MSDSQVNMVIFIHLVRGHGDFYKLLQDVEVPDSLNS